MNIIKTLQASEDLEQVLSARWARTIGQQKRYHVAFLTSPDVALIGRTEYCRGKHLNA